MNTSRDLCRFLHRVESKRSCFGLIWGAASPSSSCLTGKLEKKSIITTKEMKAKKRQRFPRKQEKLLIQLRCRATVQVSNKEWLWKLRKEKWWPRSRKANRCHQSWAVSKARMITQTQHFPVVFCGETQKVVILILNLSVRNTQDVWIKQIRLNSSNTKTRNRPLQIPSYKTAHHGTLLYL